VKTREEREAIALAVLTAPCETPSAVLADRVGVAREMVRCIRIGTRYASVLPHLERIDPAAMVRTCMDCALFERTPRRVHQANGCGQCSLGYPEAENIHYARGCGAFLATEEA
jgi:hypothetical protein